MIRGGHVIGEDKRLCNNEPLVTVLLPVLNGERWIAGCLQSLATQTYPNFEVLLVDDGCTDETISIAHKRKDLNLRVVLGPQSGLARALALGVELSRGEYIARQDVDDLSEEMRLSEQVAFLEQHPECLAVGSAAIEIDEMGQTTGAVSVPTASTDVRFRGVLFNPMIHTSVMMRRSAVINVGNYESPSEIPYPEDFDLWSRLLTVGELANLKQKLVRYRRSGTSLSATSESILSKAAATIAARNVETILGELPESDRELLGMFHVRTRKINIQECLQLERLLLSIASRLGTPLPIQWRALRTYVAPFAWVVARPRLNSIT